MPNLTFLSAASIPKEVQACSTNMSCSLKDPGSRSSSMRSRAVNLPYHRPGRMRGGGRGDGEEGEGWRGGEGRAASPLSLCAYGQQS